MHCRSRPGLRRGPVDSILEFSTIQPLRCRRLPLRPVIGNKTELFKNSIILHYLEIDPRDGVHLAGLTRLLHNDFHVFPLSQEAPVDKNLVLNPDFESTLYWANTTGGAPVQLLRSGTIADPNQRPIGRRPDLSNDGSVMAFHSPRIFTAVAPSGFEWIYSMARQ